jgi:ABC-2 type transport system ATP-binding protein
MLETRELTKVYNESVLAVNKLNMKVDDGEIYVVLGANGAGKSTTISMLLNFIEPTSGTALVGDIEIPKFPLEAKKHLAYVSENVELYRNFTARQNLSFFAKLGGRKKVTNAELDATWTCRLTGGSLYATRQDILQRHAPTLGDCHCDHEKRASRSTR